MGVLFLLFYLTIVISISYRMIRVPHLQDFFLQESAFEGARLQKRRNLTACCCTNCGCPRPRFWDLGSYDSKARNHAVRELALNNLSKKLSTKPESRSRNRQPRNRERAAPFALAVRHSYRSASAGRMRAAAEDGYSVASSEIPIETTETITPSIARGAKGSVSIEYTSAERWMK